MDGIADFLFETMLLKRVQRTGYQFLGPGRESVAEHTFSVMCIAWVLGQLVPETDQSRLLAMCLVHDLPEARMGDLNAVQKQYVAANEKMAVADMTRNLPFGPSIGALLEEFNARETLEAQLANDADQLAFLLDLKSGDRFSKLCSRLCKLNGILESCSSDTHASNSHRRPCFF